MRPGVWLLGMSARRLVPLLLFAFALLSLGLRYQQQMGRIDRDVATEETTRLRERLNIDQSRLDHRLGIADALYVRRLVGALALHDGIERAYLTDAADTVLAALLRRDLGRPLPAVLGEPDQPAELRAWLDRSSPAAIEVTTDTGRPSLRAEVPLQEGHRLLVWQDLSRPVALRRGAVQAELAREAVAVLLAVAALAVLLHLLWFRRARQLAGALAAIGAGDLTVRTRLQGRDELASIGAEADRMVERLQAEQAQLRHMNEVINRSPLVVIEWRNLPGWPVRYVSESVRQWGYEPARLRDGQVQYGDLIHPDDAERVHAEVAHYFAHGPDRYRQEYRLRCADGRWIWVDDRTVLERDAQGQVSGISGVLLDITPQKEAERAQREQAEVLRLFFDLPFLGMAVSSPHDKRWLQVNDRLCDILGYSREELLRMTWAEMTPPGDLERNVELFDELLAGQRNGYLMAKRFLRKDGRIVHAEIDVKALREADGRVRQLYATVQDVTERKAAEAALQRSQAMLLRAQEIARVGSWSQDLVTGLFDWSPQTWAIHEQDARMGPLDLEAILATLHPDDRSRVAQAYARAIETVSPYDIRYRLRMPDGRVKHLHVKGALEFDDGRPVRSVGMVVDETELLEAQRERDRLVSVMENTTDIVSMADAQGQVLYFNRAGYEVLGLSPDMPLDNVIERVHPPWAARRVLEEGIPGAVRNGRWLGETAVLDVQGRELPMSQLIMAHFDGDGQVDYFWTILRDISDRKVAEAALELERTQLAQAQAVAHVGSWTLQPAQQRLIWSDEQYRVLGYEPKGVEPSPAAFFSVVHPDDMALVQAHLERDLQATVSGVNRFEHRIVTAQGVRHVEQRANIEVDAQGQLVRIIGTTMDITERVQAGEALRRSEQRYALAARIGRTAAWEMWPLEGKAFSDANHAQLLGYDIEELGDDLARWMETVPQEARGRLAAAMQPVIDGQSDRYEVEHPVRRKDGSIGWFLVHAQRVSPPGEVPLRLVGSSLDITEAVQAKAQLRQANQELEQRVIERTAQLRQANQELEAFSYTVSHDLKAPLRGIDGYSQLLVEEYGSKLDEEGRHFVQRVRHGVQLMSDLINDLLEYSRMERRDMARDPVALLPLVQQVLDGYEADIRRQGAQVLVDLPPLTLALDREGMAVVMRNLVGNALKFSRDARPPQITIGGETQDGLHRLWVRDNGVGFDMKYHDRVFAIFQRLHRAEEFAGTGVGLALVAKAVQRMGGRVWAESAPGAGATFYLEFSA